MSLNVKERQMSVARKKSRRYTHDVLRATTESETDDSKRFPYLLQKQCEERISPSYPEVHSYMVKDDWQVIFLENLSTYRKSMVPLDTKKLVIYAYSNLNLKLKALGCKCDSIIDTRTFFALMQTLSYFPNVYSLQLDYCNLTNEHIQMLKQQLRSKKTIAELNLTGNPLEHQSFHHLLHSGLKSLVLKFCNIDEKGLKKMAKEYLNHPYDPPALIHLDLSHNPVFDEGCKYIASILRCDRTLRSLNLTDCKIREPGLKLLALSFRKFALSDEEVGIRRKIRLDYFRMLQASSEQTSLNHQDKAEMALSGPKDASSAIEETVKSHPFTNETVQDGGEIFAKGNSTLEHLNISYNQLTQPSLDLLLKTLMEQSGALEPQKGVRRLIMEGSSGNNPECHTLKNTIQELLEGRKGRNTSFAASVKSRLSIKKRKSSGASSIASGLSSRDKHSSIIA